MKTNIEDSVKKVGTEVKQSKKIFYPIIVLVALAMIIMGWYACSSSKNNSGEALTDDREVLDSLSTMLPKGSEVVARFPDDERHCMYYLNSGVLYYFDSHLKNLEEVNVSGIPSGNIVSARLTIDEKYINVVAKDKDVHRLFRINTMNRNMVDMDKTVEIKEPITEDSLPEKKKYIPSKKKEEETAEQPTTEPEPKPKREEVLQDVMVEEPAAPAQKPAE